MTIGDNHKSTQGNYIRKAGAHFTSEFSCKIKLSKFYPINNKKAVIVNFCTYRNSMCQIL